MRLVDLVEEHHCIRTLLESLRQLSPVIVANIPWRCPDQLGNLVLLLELGHVQPDEGLLAALVLVEILGDLFR